MYVCKSVLTFFFFFGSQIWVGQHAIINYFYLYVLLKKLSSLKKYDEFYDFYYQNCVLW